jgi:SAM-dependent methyltransferase
VKAKQEMLPEKHASRSALSVALPLREWEDLACLDPLWGILSAPRKQFGKWDLVEFFASGRAEIEKLMLSCALRRGDNGKALDFGSGVGRLSKALVPYFGQVFGVDISEEMMKLARTYAPEVTFLLNQADNLELFQDNFFDFIYSNIVLQHQPTGELAKAYMREFVRVVKPHGTVVFQMPYKLALRQAAQPRRRLYAILRKVGLSSGFIYNKLRLDPMRTISLPSKDVEATVLDAGARLLRVYEDDFNHYSRTYVVTKR